MPVGTIIAWPIGSDPSGIQEGRWLECNGQSVNSSKYPRLAALMSNVPDYRGMFLRGLGSQNYSQQNGIYNGTTSTTYSSSSLGSTQGDATRHVYGLLGFMQGPGDLRSGNIDKGHYNGVFYRDYTLTYGGYSQTLASFPEIGAGNITNTGIKTSVQSNLDQYWTEALKRYNYSLNVSYGQAGDIRYVSDISVNKTDEYPVLNFQRSSICIAADNEILVPIAGEIRPVNKAVRYLIKAK